MYEIREVKNSKDLKLFIDIPWQIYKNDDNWVPPLKHGLLKTLKGINNPLFMCGPHTILLAFKNGLPVGRILAGINEKLNKEKNKNEGYFSLFECINDNEASSALLDSAAQWLKERGIDTMVGPVSPTNGDDSRGLLIKGFDGPPVLMNSYNPRYYPELLENHGFCKHMDLYAFYIDPDTVPIERFGRVVEYAMKRYNFRLDKFAKNNLDRETEDMKRVLDKAMPSSWEHLTPPSIDELRAEVNSLIKFADTDLLYIARSGQEPIGFVVALPDYNQVIKKLNGRLLPLGFIKFLWYRKKINGMRAFAQFVIPNFQKKAVNSAIFYKLMLEGKRKNYKYCEGSTIGEMNTDSIRSVEGAGGKLYRVYRIYKKNL